jgi:4'-phosphopantetheinyl transferase
MKDGQHLAHPSSFIFHPSPDYSDGMELAEDEVHLWRIRTDEPCDLQALGKILSAEERTKAERYRFERDRRRSIVRRASLRRIVAGYVGVSPIELTFRYGPQGKPTLDVPFCDSRIEFNLSFSDELAVCAVGRQPLGADLEHYRTVENASLVARHFFTPAEIALQNAADEADRVFLRHWTRKEALIKATGSGLSVPLNSCDVSWLPDETAHRVSLPDAAGRLTTWFLRDLSLGPDWLAALATALPNTQIRWRS